MTKTYFLLWADSRDTEAHRLREDKVAVGSDPCACMARLQQELEPSSTSHQSSFVLSSPSTVVGTGHVSPGSSLRVLLSGSILVGAFMRESRLIRK